MKTQRNELIELVAGNGWKATELDNYNFHKRSMETWLLESLWSPIGTKAYVSFLIDPQAIFKIRMPGQSKFQMRNPSTEKKEIVLKFL